jgi:hypothetical protein
MVKTLITNKVTAIFTMTLGKPIAYAMHALPTAVSRLNLELLIASKLNKKGSRKNIFLDPFYLWAKSITELL